MAAGDRRRWHVPAWTWGTVMGGVVGQDGLFTVIEVTGDRAYDMDPVAI